MLVSGIFFVGSSLGGVVETVVVCDMLVPHHFTAMKHCVGWFSICLLVWTGQCKKNSVKLYDTRVLCIRHFGGSDSDLELCSYVCLEFGENEDRDCDGSTWGWELAPNPPPPLGSWTPPPSSTPRVNCSTMSLGGGISPGASTQLRAGMHVYPADTGTVRR